MKSIAGELGVGLGMEIRTDSPAGKGGGVTSRLGVRET